MFYVEIVMNMEFPIEIGTLLETLNLITRNYNATNYEL